MKRKSTVLLHCVVALAALLVVVVLASRLVAASADAYAITRYDLHKGGGEFIMVKGYKVSLYDYTSNKASLSVVRPDGTQLCESYRGKCVLGTPGTADANKRLSLSGAAIAVESIDTSKAVARIVTYTSRQTDTEKNIECYRRRISGPSDNAFYVTFVPANWGPEDTVDGIGPFITVARNAANLFNGLPGVKSDKSSTVSFWYYTCNVNWAPDKPLGKTANELKRKVTANWDVHAIVVIPKEYKQRDNAGLSTLPYCQHPERFNPRTYCPGCIAQAEKNSETIAHELGHMILCLDDTYPTGCDADGFTTFDTNAACVNKLKSLWANTPPRLAPDLAGLKTEKCAGVKDDNGAQCYFPAQKNIMGEPPYYGATLNALQAWRAWLVLGKFQEAILRARG